MADQDTNVAGSGYGNPYIDSLIWGARWIGRSGHILFRRRSDPDIPGAFGCRLVRLRARRLPPGGPAFRKCLQSRLSGSRQLQRGRHRLVAGPAQLSQGSLGAHDVPDGAMDSGLWLVQRAASEAGLKPGCSRAATAFSPSFMSLATPWPGTSFDGGAEGDADPFPGVTARTGSRRLRTEPGHLDHDELQRRLASCAVESDAYGWEGTPMAFDIAALQELYGANMTFKTGNNTYHCLASTRPARSGPASGMRAASTHQRGRPCRKLHHQSERCAAEGPMPVAMSPGWRDSAAASRSPTASSSKMRSAATAMTSRRQRVRQQIDRRPRQVTRWSTATAPTL